MDMIRHDNVIVNAYIIIMIIYSTKLLVNNFSVFRKHHLWDVEDAVPYNCAEHMLLVFTAYGDEIYAVATVIIITKSG